MSGRLHPRHPDDFCRPNRVIISIETLSARASCRDKGRGWVDEGALCSSSSGVRHSARHHEIQTNRIATRTSTRHPPIPASAPCPYRKRRPASLFLHSVVKLHQDGSGRILPILIGKIHQLRDIILVQNDRLREQSANPPHKQHQAHSPHENPQNTAVLTAEPHAKQNTQVSSLTRS